MQDYAIETKCVQCGYSPKNGEPRVLPIYQSTTYKYDTSEAMAKLFVVVDTDEIATQLHSLE